jgi:uncharacterized protein YjdB
MLLYNVTVTHTQGSKNDAHDVTIRDTTKNMDLQRPFSIPKANVLVTYPAVHTHYIKLTVSKLAGKENALNVVVVCVSEKCPQLVRKRWND